MVSKPGALYGLLAEFSGPDTLLKAVHSIQKAGFEKYDSYSPFPVHGMDKAMGLGRSPLGYMIGFAGAAGLIAITLFIWWVSAVDYPLVISGKELFSFQAFIPPIFAITILASATMATLGMIALNKLPRLHHPLFDAENFSRVTDNGFFICIEAADQSFDLDRTVEFLESLGALSVEAIKE